jgi:hypothetical protein
MPAYSLLDDRSPDLEMRTMKPEAFCGSITKHMRDGRSGFLDAHLLKK